MKLKSLSYGAAVLSVVALSFGALAPAYAEEASPAAPAADESAVVEQDGSREPDANACSKYVLHPQLIASDTQPDGSPIEPQSTKNATPVVFVHGWVSYIKHDDEHDGFFSKYVDPTANRHAGILLADSDVKSSLIGVAQQVPGAQVYAFDYSQVDSHWVTDPYIGPKLAKGIECLAEAYGNKVVLVGHSMGGLAIREAMSHETSAGTPVSELVSQVFTVATPNTGSVYADISGTAIENATTSKIGALRLPAKFVWDALGICNSLYQANVKCTPIPALNVFRGEGGQALRTGSQELRDLAPMPENVNYTAVSGNVQLGGFSLFGKTSDPIVSVGDLMVVDQKSATFAADKQVNNVCKYGVVSKWSVKEKIQRVEAIGHPGSERPASIVTTPCRHDALLRETNTANALVEVINQAVIENGSLVTDGE